MATTTSFTTSVVVGRGGGKRRFGDAPNIKESRAEKPSVLREKGGGRSCRVAHSNDSQETGVLSIFAVFLNSASVDTLRGCQFDRETTDEICTFLKINPSDNKEASAFLSATLGRRKRAELNRFFFLRR